MSTAVSGPTRLSDQLGRATVSVGDARMEVIDLVLLGMLGGEWTRLVDRARWGVAVSRTSDAGVSKQDLHSAATAFRYAHGLISADDFLVWLRSRSLAVADLSGYLARRLRVEAAEDAAVEPPDVEDDEAVAKILWTDAICERTLESLAKVSADLLVADLTTAPTEGEPTAVLEPPVEVVELAAADTVTGTAGRDLSELRARLQRLMALQASMDRVREEASEPAALERVLAAHGLDWLGVSGLELVFTTDGAAREARLLLVSDGLDVEEVLARSRARTESPARAHRLLIADAPAELAGVLVASAPGEVVGPWREGDGHRLLVVDGKQPASLEIPALRAKAVDERLRDLLARRSAGRVERPLEL